jgi:hypothetical protein
VEILGAGLRFDDFGLTLSNKKGVSSESEGAMTSYRLDTFLRGKLASSEIVDGFDREDLALKLILADCPPGHCRLYRDPVLIAENVDGLWTLVPQSAVLPLKAPAVRVPRHFRPAARMASHAAA